MSQRSTSRAKILSLATAVPRYQLRQEDIRGVATDIFGGAFSDFARLLPVYANAAVETRYSCMPLEWYRRPASLSERNTLYIDNALLLLEQAAENALSRAGLAFDDIHGLVVVSSSGIATPSLDARLVDKLHLNRNMQRLPIFGLGCAGGVIGLARAAQLAKSAPSKRYLYMVVELCGLTFLHSDCSKSNVIATALFGDGAAAAVIACDGEGPEIGQDQEYTWPDSLNVMGWEVVDDGLKAVFSQEIPKLVRTGMGVKVDSFLAENGLTKEEITGFLCHPGGAKVLDAIEEALELPGQRLTHSRSVLRDYGNMSAATIMFVLEAALRDPISGNYLLSAFGPGFTLALLLMHLP